MKIKKLLVPLLLAFFAYIPIQQALAAPKDDIYTNYSADGTFVGYILSGQLYYTNGIGSTVLPSMIIQKHFTPNGPKYTISYPFSDSIPNVTVKGEFLINGDTYPLKKVLYKNAGIDSQFSYIFNDHFLTTDSSLYEIPNDIISKITSAPEKSSIIFVLYGVQKDIVYHIPLKSNIIKGLPVLESLTPNDHEEYFKIKKGGSGDPENPTILVREHK